MSATPELRVGGSFKGEHVCIILMLPGLPAILDCAKLETGDGKEWVITRVNVPDNNRGQGHGRTLLTHLLALADEAGETLTLGVSSSNPKFTNSKLRTWYSRYGFVREHGMPRNSLLRVPKKPKNPAGCQRSLAPGQYWHFCGETDMGQSLPALCKECGGEFRLQRHATIPAWLTPKANLP